MKIELPDIPAIPVLVLPPLPPPFPEFWNMFNIMPPMPPIDFLLEMLKMVSVATRMINDNPFPPEVFYGASLIGPTFEDTQVLGLFFFGCDISWICDSKDFIDYGSFQSVNT
jgi:hypothetical protein